MISLETERETETVVFSHKEKKRKEEEVAAVLCFNRLLLYYK